MRLLAALPVLAVALSLAACSSGVPDAAPPPSVLVGTVRPRSGTLPVLIEAYGTVTPPSNGQASLSVAQPGQVVALAATPGAAVRQGQPIVTFAVAPSARSGYAQAQDAVSAAAQQRRSTAQLLAQQLATRDQLAQADKALADAQVALRALAAEGAGATTITLGAPFDGVVSAIPVAPGDRTQPGQTLANVARRGALVVTVGIDPALRGRLRIGAAGRIVRLDAGRGPALSGRVVRIDAMLNPRTRQVDVDLAFPPGALLSGEAVRVAVETGRAAGWIVPHRAVVFDADGRATVFQAVGGTARAVPVTVLTGAGSSDAVAGALAADAPLVVDGAFQVEDGGAVRTAGRR